MENELWKVIENDQNLFMALNESLRVVEQWLRGRCMSIHVISRAYHHPDGLIRVTHRGGRKSHCVYCKIIYN